MIISISLSEQVLREIEKLVQRGDVGSVHDFVSYAVQNQLQLEKDRNELQRDFRSLLQPPQSVMPEESKKSPPEYRKEISTETPDLSSTQTTKFTLLSSSEIKKRTKEPLWALQNKYFPLKFLLRIIQRLVAESNDGTVSIQTLQEESKKLALDLHEQLMSLDQKLDKKRGEKIAIGFPKWKKPEISFDRFFKSFAVYVSPRGETKRGMLYELGFIDVDVNKNISLTSAGNEFSNLYSPILDGYIKEGRISTHPFSEEELKFLYRYINENTDSEKKLYAFMIEKIKMGTNTPEGLNNIIKPFLEETYSKTTGYTQDTATSLRGGVTSRMVELQLIKIEKKNGRSFYNLTEKGNIFKEVEKW